MLTKKERLCCRIEGIRKRGLTDEVVKLSSDPEETRNTGSFVKSEDDVPPEEDNGLDSSGT